jgi:hypothetical protein
VRILSHGLLLDIESQDAIRGDRRTLLRDLISQRQITIEIMFSFKDTTKLNLTFERMCGAHGLEDASMVRCG